MIKPMSSSGEATYNIKELVCDNTDDIKDLPDGYPMGSSAFVIATGQIFMVNSSGEWVEI